jgi:K+-transporting ATPase KdpF subunit
LPTALRRTNSLPAAFPNAALTRAGLASSPENVGYVRRPDGHLDAWSPDGLDRRDLFVRRARRRVGEKAMSLMEWIGVLLSIAVAIYLFVALLYPEKFE